METEKIGMVREIYRAVKNWAISRLTYFSPEMVSKIRYKQALGRNLNLKNPQEFNEKLMWLKLNTYYKNPRVIQCADKVEVRKYVEKRGCKEILVDYIGVYDKASKISWGDLPKQFVLKCNHGAGYNIVCNDKNSLNIKDSEKNLNKWLKRDYSLPNAEMQYHYIKPRIICEKYLQPHKGLLPDDYKVYCYNGKAEYILLCQERETGHSKFHLFDRDWNFLNWIVSTFYEPMPEVIQPPCLDKLLYYAERLSTGFPFVRIDFYVMGDKIFFGEMTFTPCGCLDSDYTDEGNRGLSEKLILPL